MSLGSDDIIRLTLRQQYDSQECLNVFFYSWENGTGATPTQLCESWWENFKAVWRPVVPPAVTFDAILLEDLDGDRDYVEYAIPTADRSGTAAPGTNALMPSFVAYGLKILPEGRLVRPGSKRIVGVNENASNDYGVVTPTLVEQLQDIADLIPTTVEVGLGGILGFMHPVLVGFPHDESPVQHRPARTERVAVPIASCVVNPVLTTQNTRKRGRGA